MERVYIFQDESGKDVSGPMDYDTLKFLFREGCTDKFTTVAVFHKYPQGYEFLGYLSANLKSIRKTPLYWL